MGNETEQRNERVAVVLGSGRDRVGRAIADDLARSGFQIVLHANRSIDQAKEAANEMIAAGHRAFAVQANLASEAEVKSMFAEVLDTCGRVDVVANTASIWRPCSIEDTTETQLLDNFRVNTLGSFYCTQQAGLAMTKQTEGGVIINFGDASIDHPKQGYAAYYLSKGALPTLTRVMAVELAAKNPRVRVNLIQPGSIMAPPRTDEKERERRLADTLVQIADDVQPVLQTVRYLIENQALTGQSVTIDGGRHLKLG